VLLILLSLYYISVLFRSGSKKKHVNMKIQFNRKVTRKKGALIAAVKLYRVPTCHWRQLSWQLKEKIMYVRGYMLHDFRNSRFCSFWTKRKKFEEWKIVFASESRNQILTSPPSDRPRAIYSRTVAVGRALGWPMIRPPTTSWGLQYTGWPKKVSHHQFFKKSY